MVLVIIGVMWAVILLPPWLKSRRSGRPTDSIHHFRVQLAQLERAAPQVETKGTRAHRASFARGLGVPGAMRATMTRQQAQKRRRDIVTGLLIVMGATFLLGIMYVPFRPILWLHLVADIAFGAYITLLIRARHEAAEREMKVTFLPKTDAPVTYAPARPAALDVTTENVVLLAAGSHN